jgi:hypothetical protein
MPLDVPGMIRSHSENEGDVGSRTFPYNKEGVTTVFKFVVSWSEADVPVDEGAIVGLAQGDAPACDIGPSRALNIAPTRVKGPHWENRRVMLAVKCYPIDGRGARPRDVTAGGWADQFGQDVRARPRWCRWYQRGLTAGVGVGQV